MPGDHIRNLLVFLRKITRHNAVIRKLLHHNINRMLFKKFLDIHRGSVFKQFRSRILQIKAFPAFFRKSTHHRNRDAFNAPSQRIQRIAKNEQNFHFTISRMASKFRSQL